MFDDSKRLDALEAQMKSIQEAYNTTVKNINEWTKRLNDYDKAANDALKQLSDNDRVFEKLAKDTQAEFSKLQSEMKALKDVNAKQTARIAKLEADAKKK